MSDFRRKAISVVIGVLMAAGAAGVAMAAPPTPGGIPPGQVGKTKDPPPPSNPNPKQFWDDKKAKPSATAIQATTNNPSVISTTK